MPSDAWDEVEGALERTFRFEDFAASVAFVNRVAEAAEAADHHPDLTVRWGRVTVRWRTHSAGAITDRDRAMADLCDALAGG